MSALSAIEPNRLSPEQEAMLPAYRDYWRRVRCATAPADRKAAEEGVERAYRAAGLAPPERLVWCQSPIDIEVSRKATWHSFDPGGAVKTLIADEMIDRVRACVDGQVPLRMRLVAGTELAIEGNYSSATLALGNALNAEAGRVRWRAYGRTRSILRRLARHQFTPYVAFEQSWWWPHECIDILAKCAFLRNVCGFVSQTSALTGLWQVASNAGGMVPHARVCWLCERHDILALDARGRLHSGSGPAVRYPDGWSFYAWKGSTVPKWIIERADRIEPRDIDRERNPIIRRCMIDIMTPERYVATGAARRVAIDNVGILWRKNWHDWWDAWSAVEVVNGTAEPDGTRKHYFLQVPPEISSPTEAVAWTYGMSPNRYATLELRT